MLTGAKREACAALRRGVQFWQELLARVVELVALKTQDMRAAEVAARRLMGAPEEGADPKDSNQEDFVICAEAPA